MDFFHEYDDKVNELVNIYAKMDEKKVANIVKEMIDKKNTVMSLELEDENAYNISDSMIIVDVLSNIKNQTLSKILNSMEAKEASKITSLLAKTNNTLEGGE